MNFGTKKKWALKRKFLKNAISYTETIEFGWKTIILQGSPSHWPISNRKVALICVKLNSGAKNKTTSETKILKKMPCRRSKRWSLAEKCWTSYGVLSVDPFPIEKFHQFKWNRILAPKKMSTETKIFKKCHFGDRNDRISLKNDDSPAESFPLTYF